VTVPLEEVEGDSGMQEPSRKCESIRPSSVANTCCITLEPKQRIPLLDWTTVTLPPSQIREAIELCG